MRPLIRLELKIIDLPLIQAIIKSNANNMKRVQNMLYANKFKTKHMKKYLEI